MTARRRPVQDVRIWNIQDRSKHKGVAKPFVVRWVVEGLKPPFSKSFETRPQAEDYRSRLVLAHRSGEHFDLRPPGEPESWAPAADEILVHEWARLWVSHEWDGWSPHSRIAISADLAWFVSFCRHPKAPAMSEALRLYVRDTFDPAAQGDDDLEQALAAWGLKLHELTMEILAEVERKLGIGVQGQTLKHITSARRRKNAHTCIRRAVELGRLESDPWPPTPRGRAQRKSAKSTEQVDVELLPDPKRMATILQGMTSRHSGTLVYQAMSVVMYYAGPRPGEVVMLRRRSLTLPDEGWGRLRVLKADDGKGNEVAPKTGERWVPIPAALVAFLRSWIDENGLGLDDYLFRNSNGNIPDAGTWGDAVHRGCRVAGWPEIRPYDMRHACATTWLGAGVKLGETARRMGHSVEVLVRVYAGALEGDDLDANRRIDEACAGTTEWLAGDVEGSIPRSSREERSHPVVPGRTRSDGATL